MVTEIHPFVWYRATTIYHNRAKCWDIQIKIFLNLFNT